MKQRSDGFAKLSVRRILFAMVSPPLRDLAPVKPERSAGMCAANGVWGLVGQCPFDSVSRDLLHSFSTVEAVARKPWAGTFSYLESMRRIEALSGKRDPIRSNDFQICACPRKGAPTCRRRISSSRPAQ